SEYVEQLALREAVRERAEPDLESRRGGVRGGDLQSVRVAAGDAHRVAVQVVADNTHLATHDLRVEGLVGARPGAQEAGVVGDAFAPHALAPSRSTQILDESAERWRCVPLLWIVQIVAGERRAEFLEHRHQLSTRD